MPPRCAVTHVAVTRVATTTRPHLSYPPPPPPWTVRLQAPGRAVGHGAGRIASRVSGATRVEPRRHGASQLAAHTPFGPASEADVRCVERTKKLAVIAASHSSQPTRTRASERRCACIGTPWARWAETMSCGPCPYAQAHAYTRCACIVAAPHKHTGFAREEPRRGGGGRRRARWHRRDGGPTCL